MSAIRNAQSTSPSIESSAPNSRLLEVKNLTSEFRTQKGSLLANKNVCLSIEHGKTLGIVGESGSGKSVFCRSILGLLPSPPARILSGEIWFDGRDLLKLPEPAMRKVRGVEISMIFQDPMTCLNPVYRIGEQITETIRLHKHISRQEAHDIGINLLRQVGIPSPEMRISSYPHQLSGGMRQRVMIAMAISTQPKLLIADEPTTALDVTIQDQILALLLELQAQVNMSIILVSHDLGIVAETSDEVAVMYAGQVMEMAPTQAIFNRPLHPYTNGLLSSIPRMEGSQQRLVPIQGQPPNLLKLPQGCPFVERCPIARPEICSKTPIQLQEVEAGHFSACLFSEKVSA
jgi:oligopeptide/dipeptide ABC transporter ATP-binding protein